MANVDSHVFCKCQLMNGFMGIIYFLILLYESISVHELPNIPRNGGGGVLAHVFLLITSTSESSQHQRASNKRATAEYE